MSRDGTFHRPTGNRDRVTDSADPKYSIRLADVFAPAVTLRVASDSNHFESIREKYCSTDNPFKPTGLFNWNRLATVNLSIRLSPISFSRLTLYDLSSSLELPIAAILSA